MRRKIRVMTFNIRNSQGDHDTIHDWKYRKEKIVLLIKKYTPLVVGMQEVLNDQLLYLIDNLDQYKYIGVGRDDGKLRGEFSPIFYDRRLDIGKFGTFWFSDTPEVHSNSWSWCPRICTWMKVKKPFDFSFYNTHLDEKDPSARLKSISLLIAKIKEDNSPYNILSGDFNFEMSSTEYAEAIRYFRDSYLEMSNKSESISSYHGFTGNKIGTRLIDYIFLEGPWIIHAADFITENIGNNKNTYPSDHWPLIVDLEKEN